MLVGGSSLVTFAYLTTLYFSVESFGGGLPFATVGAVYLVGRPCFRGTHDRVVSGPSRQH